MTQDNPYQPPESERLTETSDPGPAGGAVDAPRDIWSIPSAVWENGKRLWSRCAETNLLWVILGIQLLHLGSTSGMQFMMGSEPGPSLGQSEPELTPEQLAELWPVFLGIIVLVVGLQLVTGSLMRPMHRLLFDGSKSVGGVGDALGMGLPRIPHLIGTGILVYVLLFLGLLACLVPGIVISVAMWFPLYLAMTTDLGVIDSLTSGWEFFKRQWSAYLVGGLALIVAYMAVLCPLMALSFVPVAGPFIWVSAAGILAALLFVAFMSLMGTLEQRDREMHGSTVWEEPDQRPGTGRGQPPGSDDQTPTGGGAGQEW